MKYFQNFERVYVASHLLFFYTSVVSRKTNHSRLLKGSYKLWEYLIRLWHHVKYGQEKTLKLPPPEFCSELEFQSLCAYNIYRAIKYVLKAEFEER